MSALCGAVAVMASIGLTSAASLKSICDTTYAQAALPSIPAITIDKSSLTTSAHINYSVASNVMYPAATFDYCNVTFAYTHSGRNDKVQVTYWLPAPDKFQNRFLSTGGGGLAINSGSSSVAGGVSHGAAAGLTDGGFGSFNNQFDSVFLLANGTVDWEKVYLFGYEAIHEMTVIGHAFTKSFFNTTKLYRYYQACSEGGREGFSQVQRYRDQFDGAVIGAPALRYGQQQVNHLTSNIIEKTLNYYPPPCELEKIVNLTIAACDPLDGLVDGVVSRSDLCQLHLNSSSFIGQPYHCTASSGGSLGFSNGFGNSGASPAQNGTVSAKAVEVANTIIAGLKDSQGRQVYLSYQPAASFVDAQTTYNNATASWTLSQSSLGGEWVERFLLLHNASSLPSLDSVTYDTLRDWMLYGMQRYYDSLQTTWPDLTEYQSAGGKVLHYHGESDNSIPAASSVRYFESVRSIMYPDQSYNDSAEALKKWYKLFLVPGAAHCNTNSEQLNGPFPQTQLLTMIDWVENGVEPETLPAQFLAGIYKGQNTSICAWPLRPLFGGNGTMPECVYDQASIDTWHHDLNASKIPVY